MYFGLFLGDKGHHDREDRQQIMEVRRQEPESGCSLSSTSREMSVDRK